MLVNAEDTEQAASSLLDVAKIGNKANNRRAFMVFLAFL